MQGIEFGGKHSYRDFGMTIKERHIGNPSKNKKVERIPYSDIEYDFSSLYGGEEFSERVLTYVFNITTEANPSHYYAVETEFNNWLSASVGKSILKDDAVEGFRFNAEVVEGTDSNYIAGYGTLSVVFTAYPYKIAVLPEGHDIWDEFFFDWDYAQDTSFNVNGSQEITLQNPGSKKVQPTIVSNRAVQIVKDGVTYSIPSGTTKSVDFTLSPGENRLRIIGTASVSFEYYKEMI